jgi:hypothetical protein
MGLKNEDEVIIENQDGIKSGKIKILTTPGMRPDAVFLPHGFGLNDRGLLDYTDRKLSDNSLISKYNIDPISGGTGLRVNFVRLLADNNVLSPTVEVNFTGISSNKVSGIQQDESQPKIFNRIIKKKTSTIREGC